MCASSGDYSNEYYGYSLIRGIRRSLLGAAREQKQRIESHPMGTLMIDSDVMPVSPNQINTHHRLFGFGLFDVSIKSTHGSLIGMNVFDHIL